VSRGATLLILALAAPGFAPAAASRELPGSPWRARPSPRLSAVAETRPEIVTINAALRFFQRVVSPVDGPRCNLVPTCSEFSRQAVRRYGLLVGVMLTCGRLLRDNNSAAGFYRRVRIGDRIVLYDPPEDHWPLGKARTPERAR
jgi:uncharacterized protein